MERDNLPGVRTTCLENRALSPWGPAGAGVEPGESEAHLQTSAGAAEALGCSWARAAGGRGPGWWGELGAVGRAGCGRGFCGARGL